MSAVLERDAAVGVLPTDVRLSAGRRILVGVARAEAALKVSLQKWSIPAARVSLGAIFFIFGFLKFFPGVSPAEGLVQRTFDKLTFGLVGPTAAMVITAVVEVAAGAMLMLGGRLTRPGLVVFAAAEVGILSSFVLLFDEMFTPTGPSLAGQYVLKNLVLIAAAVVVASRALHGPDPRH